MFFVSSYGITKQSVAFSQNENSSSCSAGSINFHIQSRKIYETGCLHFKTFKTNQPDTDELKQNHHVWCFVEGHSDYFWFINIIKLHFV